MNLRETILMAKAEGAMEASDRSSSILRAIIQTLNEAGILDYEGNPLSDINILQGVRRLLDRAGRQ